jgi:CelD/BcsL family acetyltransferase involved in cellulose biosynthesis
MPRNTLGLHIRRVAARELAPEDVTAWTALQETDPLLASPYFRPEFTIAVASVRDDVWVAVIERGGEPVGFFSYQNDGMRIGRPVGGPLSDYQGIIAKRDLAWDAAQLIRECGLREWKFDHLLAAQEPFRRFHQVATQSPVIDLSKGYEAYVEDRRRAGSERIVKVLRQRRKLEREVGPLRFELHSTDHAVLATLMRWKSRQYQELGTVDAFDIPWVVKVVEKIHSMQGESFAGVLSVLYAGHQPIAAHMGMRSKTVWHYWFPAYDPAFGKSSPGNILLLEMAERASSLGISSIDLGKGAELYKQSLMNRAIPIAQGAVTVTSFLRAVRGSRVGLRALLRRSPLEGLAKRTGKILGRVETWLRFR